MKKVKVLFVCMGNICRSPTAQGVFENLVHNEGLSEFFHIDSAGTHAYHVSEPPDPRAQEAAGKRNIDLGSQRARRVQAKDFEVFDYVIAMDRDNQAHLEELAPTELQHKLKLFMEFAPDLGIDEVPDPYYGGRNGFEHVLDLVDEASRGLLQTIVKQFRI